MSNGRLVLLFIGSLLIGCAAFWHRDLQFVNSSLNGLVAIAAIVFGILGAWMSILKPIVEESATDDEQKNRQTDIALEIAPALKQATFILAAVVFLKILLPLSSGIGQTILLVVRTQRPEWIFPVLVEPVLMATLGSVIVFLYLMEIFVLLVTLLPVLSMERTRNVQDFYEQEADDPATKQLQK